MHKVTQQNEGWAGQKLTRAVCVQVWILGSGGGVCRGAKLWLWNARALHKLCFPQRGWEQKAYTHIEKETTCTHTHAHTQRNTHRHTDQGDGRRQGRENRRTGQKGGKTESLWTWSRTLIKWKHPEGFLRQLCICLGSNKTKAWVNKQHGQSELG